MQRVSKAWRWPFGGAILACVAAMFVPIGVLLWAHLLVAGSAVAALARQAHREIPFPAAVAQLFMGGDDRGVLRARVLSAAMCLPKGRADLALSRIKAVMPDLTRVLGPKDPETLSARFLYLQLRGEAGEVPDRLAEMEALIADITPVLGPGHPDTLACWHCLAEWLDADGRAEEAEAAYRHVITTGTEQLGPDHNQVLIARGSLAILRYYKTGEHKNAAIEEMTAVVDSMERALGPANPTTAGTRRLLAQWKD